MADRIPLRILVAEDNIINQKVALRLLERMGYRADVVSNGLEVIEALERQRYDLVLMDVQMPEMDGLEATRQICLRWPKEKRPQIIAMTANAMKEDREQCLAAGMDDYVSKPVKMEDLQAALERSGAVLTTIISQATAPAMEAIDRDILDWIRFDEDGTNILIEITEIFLQETPGRLANLRQAIERSDAKAVESIAHRLKGSGATLGAKQMSKLCSEMENLARTGSLLNANTFIAPIEAEFERVREALMKEVLSNKGC